MFITTLKCFYAYYYLINDNVMIGNDVKKIFSDQDYISLCYWNNEGIPQYLNNTFDETFGLNGNYLTIQEFRNHIDDYCYTEDLNKLDAMINNLIINEASSQSMDLRIRLESKTKWLKLHISEYEKGIRLMATDITEDKETLSKMMRRENLLKDTNQKLSSNITLSERDKDNISKNSELIAKCLKDSEIFPWECNLKEGILKVNFQQGEDNSFMQMMTEFRIDQLLEIIKNEDIEKIQFDKAKEKINNNELFSIDLRLKINNEYKWFEIRAAIAHRGSDDKMSVIRGVAINVNDRKSKEHSVEQEKSMLLKSDKSKNVYYSNLVHEIRTPLHAIVGFSDIIASSDDKEERMKYLEAIRDNNEKLMNIIEVISDDNDSYHESRLNESRISLWEYMVERQQIYSMKINSQSKIFFNNQYDSSVYIFDKEKVTEVMDSLLKTSLKINKSGNINFGYEIIDSKIKFFIKDNGDGLSEEQIKGIFDRPEREDDNSDYIGLSLCKSLVYMMNGEIDVISSKGLGTCFYFMIPLKMEKASAQPELQRQRPTSVTKGGDEKPKILIAEDVIYSFQMLKAILEDRFTVLHAENGEQAVDIFMKEKPVFIFMDIKMPLMDGIEATRQIRAVDPVVPIVVLTAYAVRSLKKQASEAGCTDLLTKPSTTRQINSTIKKHLFQRR